MNCLKFQNNLEPLIVLYFDEVWVYDKTEERKDGEHIW